MRRREIIERMDGSRKAEWELAMAMDMLRIADKVDSIIIVSGNGVFADIVPALQAKGVKVECCAFKESMSDLLGRAVDQYHLLGEEHLYSGGLPASTGRRDAEAPEPPEPPAELEAEA